MKIVDLNIHTLKSPLAEPFAFSQGWVHQRSATLLEVVTDDGLRGVGELHPASGTGAWEAALVNCLSANDRILMCETGQFASLWFKLAEKLGLNPELISTDWRHGTDASAIEARLIDDTAHDIKAV